MKGMIKDALILFAITLVAGLLLGGVNELTKGPIALAKEQAKQEAYKEVFNEADNFIEMEIDENTLEGFKETSDITSVDVDSVVEAYKGENLLGYVVTVTSHEGYGGDIQFSCGLTLDGILNGISILSISETAGLGMKAGDVLVPQFANKDATSTFTYTKTGSTSDSEIDAISGATITTKAFINGVNYATSFYKEALIGEDK